jgi:hypothetical protein
MNRNLFTLHNARYLLKKELVDTFVMTHSFERLLSPKNQIIIGSRGSGKTALLKVLSHDHLSLLDNALAKDIIANKTYIGIHISTKTKFVGGLKNKDWQNDEEKEYYFRWLMNIASCVALLETLRSCLTTYITTDEERITKEVELTREISASWFPEVNGIVSIDDLLMELEKVVTLRSRRNLEKKIYNIVRNEKPIGLTFELDLYDPLILGINIINRRLKFPEYTTWFICIDEIEMLDEFHHRILNSYMRANMGNIFFKFTTLPYCHYTLDTNFTVPLDIRHDVEYIYIDQDPSFEYRAIPSNSNAYQLFKKRAQLSKPEFAKYTFQDLFGKSYLLDNKTISYDELVKHPNQKLTLEELEQLVQDNETLSLFLKHTNEATKRRGVDLLSRKRIQEFGNQFGRKLRALLYLKEYEATKTGKSNLELYCGAKTVINVGDANPRKLIDIFSEMLSVVESGKYNKQKSSVHTELPQPIISYSNQNWVLASISERELNRYRIEKNFGTGLHEFILAIGNFMYDHIHNNKLNLEQISSIEITKNVGEIEWKLIERAVQRGLIYPNINSQNPDYMPAKEGEFHLAFILSPRFKLLPRKGDSRRLSNIQNFQQLSINFDA